MFKLIKQFSFIFFFFILCTNSIFSQEFRIIKFNQLKGDIILRYFGISDSESNESNYLKNISNKYFEYGLGISSEGYIYHPNLISFSVLGDYYFNKTETSYLNETEKHKLNHNNYNFTLSILKKKPISISVYTGESSNAGARKFEGLIFANFKTYGAQLVSRYQKIPFTLIYETQHSTSENINFVERDDTNKGFEFYSEFLKKSNLEWDVHIINKKHSDKLHDNNFRASDLRSRFVFKPGNSLKNRLSANLSVNHLSGDVKLKNSNLLINYLHRIKKNFRTGSSLSFNESKLNVNKSRRYSINAYVNHQLYESLNSQLELTQTYENSDFENNRLNNIRATILYTKKIPKGRLSISFSQNKSWENYSSHAETGFESTEYQFDASDTLIISGLNIDRSSVFLTNNTLSIKYIEGLDYILIVSGTYINIIRLKEGNIPENGDIIVHYNFNLNPDHHLENHHFSSHFNLNLFKYISLSYMSEGVNHNINSDFIVTSLEEYKKHRKGIRFNSNSITAEVFSEQYNSTFDSYATDYSILSIRRKLWHTFMLMYNRTDNSTIYQNTYISSRLKSESLTLSYLPLRHIKLEIMARKLFLKYNEEVTERESAIVKLRWFYRSLSLDIFYEHILNDQSTLNKRLHDMYSIVLRRRF